MTTGDDRRVRRMERRTFRNPYDDLDSIPDEVLDAIMWSGMPNEIARMRADAEAGDAQAAELLRLVHEALDGPITES